MLPLLGLELLAGFAAAEFEGLFHFLTLLSFHNLPRYAISPFSKSRCGANGLEIAPARISGSQGQGQTDL